MGEGGRLMRLIYKKKLLLILAALLIIVADIAFIYSRGRSDKYSLSSPDSSRPRQEAGIHAGRRNRRKNRNVNRAMNEYEMAHVDTTTTVRTFNDGHSARAE